MAYVILYFLEVIVAIIILFVNFNRNLLLLILFVICLNVYIFSEVCPYYFSIQISYTI